MANEDKNKPSATPAAPAAVEPSDAAAVQAKLAKEAEERAQEVRAANAAREFAALAATEGTGFTVQAGMSVSTLRGVVDAGQPVSELDFFRGKLDLDDLVARGALVKS